ncbi:hypothetical protein PQ465_14190 [Sphingobacterium oryzagri]|uniref:DUF6850 domain-containing protein n=1 Tax=Sphingobacterium oryzagri TaxID=3025669 RepID=A0ABY7WG30_9SPHI|nr:DUF6850 family outer membrane beta-barrel protein [Sphingobacterium sp. KACC 22765]WDF67452.1 hypothetical protein PQ465_14190 [Sphingobacterium sp. KACC 22765]
MRYILLTWFVFCSLFVCGQQPFRSDSLSNNFSASQRIDFLFRNASLMQDSLGQKFGEATLSFQVDERNFRNSQVAQSRSDATLETRGINYLGKKTVVSGMFSYQKSWEDSLSYFLAGLEDNSMPSYYFVEKAGQFERQTYRANAHIGQQVAKHWSVNAALDYTHHWATRSVDPRMDLYSMTWIFKPAVSYAFGRYLLSLQPIYGRGSGQTDLSYKKSSASEGSAYSKSHYVSNYGYGTIQRLDTATLRQYDRYRGLYFQGRFRPRSYELLWSLGYEKRINENTHDAVNLDNYYVTQSFDLQTYSIDVLIAQQRANGASLQLQFFTRNGVDAGRFRGHNYFLSQWKLDLSAVQNFQEQSAWPIALGLNVNAAYDERDDAASSHYAERQWLTFALPFSVTRIWNRRERLRLQLNPSLRLPLRNSLVIPATQINSFSLGIAYPEYYYYAVKSMSIASRLTFLTSKLWTKSPLGFFVEANVTKPFRYRGDIFPGTTLYSGNNFQAKAGLSFYL